MQNKLLNEYYLVLYFRRGEPTKLEKLSNWELGGILLLIKKYPQGLLNGYSKEYYVQAVKYILKCRLHCENRKFMATETRYANRAYVKAEQLTNNILKCMMITESRYKRKLVIY